MYIVDCASERCTAPGLAHNLFRRSKHSPHLQSSIFGPEDRRTPFSSIFDLRPRRSKNPLFFDLRPRGTRRRSNGRRGGCDFFEDYLSTYVCIYMYIYIYIYIYISGRARGGCGYSIFILNIEYFHIEYFHMFMGAVRRAGTLTSAKVIR